MALIVCKESRSDTRKVGPVLHLRTAHNREFSLCNRVMGSDVHPEPGWEVAQHICEQCLRIGQFFALVQEAAQCES